MPAIKNIKTVNTKYPPDITPTTAKICDNNEVSLTFLTINTEMINKTNAARILISPFFSNQFLKNSIILFMAFYFIYSLYSPHSFIAASETASTTLSKSFPYKPAQEKHPISKTE